jgi:Omp85 superfamily domain
VNGRISEAQLYAGYTNLGGRLQYTTAVSQTPYYVYLGTGYEPYQGGSDFLTERTQIARYIIRSIDLVGLRPRNRFSRYELGAEFTNIDRATMFLSRVVGNGTFIPYSPYQASRPHSVPSFNYFAPYVAYVSDNTLFGYTGPIMGRRFRFQVQPSIGSFRWMNYLADYRRYDPILFNFLTVATRFTSVIRVGRDEMQMPQYLGSPNNLLYLRGYDHSNGFSNYCNPLGGGAGCTASELLGSRAAVASAELRFPLIRRFDLGLLPISLPPVEGLFFAEGGAAWSAGQTLTLKKPANYDYRENRYPLRSYGAGIRLNLFGFALVRWDYSIPLDRPVKRGFWTWSLGPSF